MPRKQRRRQLTISQNTQKQVKHERTKLVPKNENQAQYINSIHNSDILICNGPAGTGKTVIAVSVALELLFAEKIEKIIITRPIVESGEHLGHLPGSLQEKIRPYLEPIYDSLHKFLSYQEIKTLENANKLIIAPIAYMRGKTWENSIIIVDEAQNCNILQLKLILTRIGENSKLILNGDISQSDVSTKSNALLQCINKLKNIDNKINVFEFKEQDIVRHSLIHKILKALS